MTKYRPYLALDAWRGIASLWVVMFHTSLDEFHPELKQRLFYKFGHEGLAGVWIFFVISGYCIANAAASNLQRNQTLKMYVVARARRIYPPCLIAVAVYFLFAGAAQIAAQHGYMKNGVLASEQVLNHGALYYIANFSLTQRLFRQDYITSICWTLCYEVGFYLLIGLALCAARGRGPRTMLNLLHGLTAMTLLAVIFIPSRIGYPFDLWPLFGLGVLVFDLLQHQKDWQPKVAAPLIVALFLVFASTTSAHGPDGPDTFGDKSFLFALAVAVLLVVLYRFDAKLVKVKPVRFIAWVGTFSYSLYLTHYMVLSITVKGLEAAHLGLKFCYLCSFIAMAAAIAYARLFYHIVERRCLNTKQPSAAQAPAKVSSPVGDLLAQITGARLRPAGQEAGVQSDLVGAKEEIRGN